VHSTASASATKLEERTPQARPDQTSNQPAETEASHEGGDDRPDDLRGLAEHEHQLRDQTTC
jgi:hypothetical protein